MRIVINEWLDQMQNALLNTYGLDLSIKVVGWGGKACLFLYMKSSI